MFSRALVEVLALEHAATMFGEVMEATQTHLEALAEAYGKPLQRIRFVWESGVGEEQRLKTHVICGTTVSVSDAAERWIEAVERCRLWSEGGGVIQTCVVDLVTVCYERWQTAVSVLPEDAWRDELYPVRVLERVAFLVNLCESLSLTQAEAAILVLAPFLYEAVLATAVIEVAQAEPYTLTETGQTTGIRAVLERRFRAMPALIRKAARLQEKGQLAEHNAMAAWLMYRCIFRLPELWSVEPVGLLPVAWVERWQVVIGSHAQAVQETLQLARLLEMARAIQSDPERLERMDRPGALKAVTYVSPGAAQEMAVQEKALAYLLLLAGRLAIDARTLPEIVVDHIGLTDSVQPVAVLETLRQAKWLPVAQGRSLQAICAHPALDVALREYVAGAQLVVEEIQTYIHQQKDGLGVLAGLPLRLTARGVTAEMLASGQLAYEGAPIRFQLTSSEVRELLISESLYADPTLAIRELYQNALDACRYREARLTYLQRVGQYEGPAWRGRIVFRQGVDEAGRPFIECEDNGIGMGRRELSEAFAQAGRRFADMPEFIEEQSQWLQCEPPIRLYPSRNLCLRRGNGLRSVSLFMDIRFL